MDTLRQLTAAEAGERVLIDRSERWVPRSYIGVAKIATEILDVTIRMCSVILKTPRTTSCIRWRRQGAPKGLLHGAMPGGFTGPPRTGQLVAGNRGTFVATAICTLTLYRSR